MIYDEMEDRPNLADERAEAWEFWHERANKFETEVVQLRIRNEKLHVVAKNVSHALMSFTPGGSEYFTRLQVGDWEDYYADADVCQRRVRERIDKAEEGVRDQYRMVHRLSAALKDAINDLEHSGYCHDHPQLEKLRAALSTSDQTVKP